MQVGTISAIHRYPVKSAGGETLSQVELGARGIPGDRAWAVRDEKNGGIRGGKKIPSLMRLSAHYPKPPAATGSSPAAIRLPDGSSLSTGDSDANERLSKAVEHPVSLWPLLPPDALDHYRRGAPTHEDFDREMRAIFGRAPDEPLPDLSVFPPEILEFESPPGTYFDAFPLLVVSESSLRAMQDRAPGSRFDVRRFRPNLVVADAGSDDPFPERSWCGRRIEVGTAVLEITVDCPRCVMVTHGFDDLPKDPSVMRALVRETGGHLGVYATVSQPGAVRTGDSVDLLA